MTSPRAFTAAELVAFEDDIAEEFNARHIRAPVHLGSGNEQQLIDLFAEVADHDWVLCSWRSHFHCLLKGVPPDELRAAIMDGASISLCFPAQRIFSSAIVGGIVPIAVGLGLAIARDGGPERVWCFVGDMTSETGSFEESLKYVRNHHLPVTYVVEDNGRSIETDTKAVWGLDSLSRADQHDAHVRHYTYEGRWPHAGAGQRVRF